VTPFLGLDDAINYVARTVGSRGQNMKDPKKKPEESNEKRTELEQSSDASSEDETKRLRTFTVQDLERLLKDEKPGQ
jgi:hypothetical protein